MAAVAIVRTFLSSKDYNTAVVEREFMNWHFKARARFKAKEADYKNFRSCKRVKPRPSKPVRTPVHNYGPGYIRPEKWAIFKGVVDGKDVYKPFTPTA